MSNSRLFCFGLGYTARALARRLVVKGWSIAGTTRSPSEQPALSKLGIQALLFERDRPFADFAGTLAGYTHILSSVPPNGLGDPVLAAHGRDLAGMSGVQWIGYLSTTGVYGDRGGAWVSEADEPRPAGERGKRRLAAEAGWLELWCDRGLPVHIFRLAGIYGPGRSPFDALRAGRARRIDKPGQVFGRIHVDDIAQTLEASMARPRPGAVYNLSDDDPAPPGDVVAYAAELLGIAPPPLISLEEAELSEMARSFYAESKRVRNELIKRELGVRLAFPDYRAGLADILKDERER